MTGRTQQTRVGRSLSEINVIFSVAIQTSCLGPALFLLYISALVDAFSNGVVVKHFADDVKLYSNCMIKVNDIDSELQTNLDKLCKCANNWQNPILYTKCNVLEIA